MLIEVDQKEFKNRFVNQTNPFITSAFLELNKNKVEKLVYLIENKKKRIDLGIIAGIKNGVLMAPFSAPFGGFYFRHDNVKVNEINIFLDLLKNYVINEQLSKFSLTLSPDIYNPSFNAKMINALIRNEFSMGIPEITNWVDLKQFSGIFSDSNTRTNYGKAVRNKLEFVPISEVDYKKQSFDLICENRRNFGRPIYMTFDDILATENLWPIDFFRVHDSENNLLASAIFYRSHAKIIYGAFWGDNELGRRLKAMDFLALNLWNHYKNLHYNFVDFGISTESGIPNEGLLRFKEAHNSLSSLRFSFEWKP